MKKLVRNCRHTVTLSILDGTSVLFIEGWMESRG
jgi:DNA-binding IclR family transcriptional regulator